MRYHYDKKADALYVRFNENRYVHSDEVREGVIFDYDNKDRLIAIEILDASKILPHDARLNSSRKQSIAAV